MKRLLSAFLIAAAVAAGCAAPQASHPVLAAIPTFGISNTGGASSAPDLTVSVTGAPAARLDVTLVPSDTRYDRIRVDGVIVVDSGMVGSQNFKWQVNGIDPPSNVVKNNWVNDLTATAITVQTGTDTTFGTADPSRRMFLNGYIYMAQAGYKTAMLNWTSEQITTNPFRNFGIEIWKDAATAVTSWGVVDTAGGNAFGVGTKINFWLDGGT